MASARLLQADRALRQWAIRFGDGTVRPARVAVGCLVEPLAGDLVQVHADAQACWILTVLERDASAPVLTLDAAGRTLRVRAEALQLEGACQVTLAAPRVDVRAGVATLEADQRYVHIEGIDEVCAGSLHLRADRHLGMHAKSAMVTASALLKLDGGQIHMG